MTRARVGPGTAATGRPKAGHQGEGGGRPRADPAKVAQAVALVEHGDLTAEDAAAQVGIGGNTVRRAMKAPPPPVAAPQLAPATDNDRKVDELISTSRTWRRVCEALARFARRHPTIAPDLAAELRGLNL